MNAAPLLKFRPSGRQVARCVRSRAFVRGLMGPFGSGKSTGCIMDIVYKSFLQPIWPDGVIRARWAVIRNTYPELQTTTIKSWHQWFPEEHGRWQKQGPPAHWLELETIRDGKPVPVEIEVIFLALDRPEDVSKLLSMELTGAWVNEAREVTWAVIEGLTGRVGRYPPKVVGGAAWSGIIMDTNPPDADSDWYRIFEEERPDGYEIFRQPSGLSARAENIENLPEGYYERQLPGKSEQWINVYVHGRYGYSQDGKVVFPEYDDARHCADHALKADPKLPVIVGGDAGLTPALTFWQPTPSGQRRGVGELTGDNVDAAEFGDMANAYIAGRFLGFPPDAFRGVVDPTAIYKHDSGPAAWRDVMEAKTGIRFSPASTNEIEPRLGAVKASLRRTLSGGFPQFLIGPDMKVLRKALNAKYQFKRVQSANGARYQDEPDKSHPWSDVCDSMEYGHLEMDGGHLAAVRTAHQGQFTRPVVASSDFRVL